MDEENPENIEAPGALPLGVHLTALFLDIIVVILSIPALGAALVCLLAMGKAAHKPSEALIAIGSSLGVLGGLLAILGMILGSTWLSLLIRARHAMDERFARWPKHPKDSIANPMLMVTQIHAALPVLAGVVIKLIGYWETSWAWLVLWAATVIFCEVAMRLIGRKGLPW